MKLLSNEQLQSALECGNKAFCYECKMYSNKNGEDCLVIVANTAIALRDMLQKIVANKNHAAELDCRLYEAEKMLKEMEREVEGK